MIAVVIPVRNGWQDTKECLESLRKSTVPLKIILVDGGSTDETINLTKEFEEVFYLHDEEKTTFSAMVNLGARYALYALKDVKSVLILNNDTIVHPEAIARMQMQFYNNIGIVTPRINYYGTPKVWSAGGSHDLRFGLTWHENIRSEDAGLSNYADWGSGCALLISAECWCGTGGFDERLPWYDSDVDFCIRARLKNFAVWYTNKAVIEHKIGQSSPTWWQYKEKIRGRFLLVRKHLDLWYLPLALAGFLVQSLWRWIKK